VCTERANHGGREREETLIWWPFISYTDTWDRRSTDVASVWFGHFIRIPPKEFNECIVCFSKFYQMKNLIILFS
jgi:hypothetical protein